MLKLCVLLCAHMTTFSLAASDAGDGGKSSEVEIDWGYLVESVGRLGEYSLLSAKNFFFVAQGVDVKKSTENVETYIDKFEEYLKKMTKGNYYGTIPAAENVSTDASKVLKELADRWEPLKEYMRANVAGLDQKPTATKKKVAYDGGAILTLVEDSCSQAMQVYVKAAEDHQIEMSKLRQIKYSTEQLTMIGVLTIDVVFIALGIDKLEDLARDRKTFDDVHTMLLDGNHLFGIPLLKDVCKLRAMREVTYHWKVYDTAVQHVMQEQTPEARAKAANHEIPVIVEESQYVVEEMETAVHLFVDDPGTCDATANITDYQWSDMISLISNQQMLTEKASQLMASIKAGVSVSANTVELTLTIEETTTNIAQLLQGDKLAKIPSPVTKEIAQSAAIIRGKWDILSADLRDATVGGTISNVIVEKVARGSRDLLKEQKATQELLVRQTIDNAPSVGATVIVLAMEQRMLIQKMSKEAMLVKGDIDATANSERARESARSWREVNRMLLDGGIPKSNSSTGVPKTRNVCIIRLMQDSMDSYEALEKNVMQLLENGDNGDTLMSLIKPSIAKTTAAEEAYAERTNLTCEKNKALSAEEVIASIFKVGEMRLLTQRVQKEALLKGTDIGNMAETATETSNCIDHVTFGNQSGNIVAGPTQEVLDTMFAVDLLWASLQSDLNKTTLAETALALNKNSAGEILDEIEAVMSWYLSIAGTAVSAGEFPAQIVNKASRQSMLVEKMAKEALIMANIPAVRRLQASVSVTETIKLYEKSDSELRDSTHSQRTELLEKIGGVDAAWQTYKQKLQVVADGSKKIEDLTEMQNTLELLLTRLDEAMPLFQTTVAFKPHTTPTWVVPVQWCVPLAIFCVPSISGVIRGLTGST